MAEPRADGLSYGRLGEPIYNTSLRQWLFSRELKEGQLVSPCHTAVA